jgi:ParB family chromosome partitioning protein
MDFDPEQKKLAGCHVSIGGDGKIDIYRGLVKKQDQKKLTGTNADDGDEPATVAKPKIPESLRRDLELYRLQAAQIEIAKHPEIAFDLAVFAIAHRVLDHMPVYSGPQISVSQTFAPASVKDTSPLAQMELKKIEESLPRAWLDHENEDEKFAAFCQLSRQDKLRLLAYSTAMSLKPQLNVPSDEPNYDFFEDALALTGGNVARYWRPTTESYLKRIKTEQLLEIGRDIFGDTWAQKVSKLKKGQIVNQLDTAFANPEKPEHSHEEAEKLRNWLPEGMALNAAPLTKTWQQKVTAAAKTSAKRVAGI